MNTTDLYPESVASDGKDRDDVNMQSLELRIELAVSQRDKLDEVVFTSRQNQNISFLFSLSAILASSVFASFAYRGVDAALWLFVAPVALIVIFALAYTTEIYMEGRRITYKSKQLIARLDDGIAESKSFLLEHRF